MFQLTKLPARITVMVLALFLLSRAQSINITGTVVDSTKSVAIANALVKIVEIPKCSTRTNASGAFTLVYSTGILKGNSETPAIPEISLEGNSVLIKSVSPLKKISVDVFNCKGVCIRSIEQVTGSNGSVVFANLWQMPGWYCVKVGINGENYTLSGIGMDHVFLSNSAASLVSPNERRFAKSLATTLNIKATGFLERKIPLTVTTGNVGTIRLWKIPDSVSVVSFGAKGDGVTDDRAAFQAAANAARDAGKVLVVPPPPGKQHYKLTGFVTVYTSLIGINMPDIRMYGADGNWNHIMFKWINYQGTGIVIRGLHLNGQCGGGGEWDHNIMLQGCKNVTIENNLLENPCGDCILLGGDGYPKPSENILIQNNTMNNPKRCDIALIWSDGVTIQNNNINKSNNYVSAIDAEPSPCCPQDLQRVWNTKILNNKFNSPDAFSVMFYAFDGYPPNDVAGGNATITGNTHTGPSPFFYQTGKWTNIQVAPGQ